MPSIVLVKLGLVQFGLGQVKLGLVSFGQGNVEYGHVWCCIGLVQSSRVKLWVK